MNSTSHLRESLNNYVCHVHVLIVVLHVFFSALKLDVVPVQASRLCSAHSSRHAIGLEGVEEEVGRAL